MFGCEGLKLGEEGEKECPLKKCQSQQWRGERETEKEIDVYILI